MKKTIRLKSSPKDKYYFGQMSYLVAYDHAAGSPDRYTVFLLNVDDPITIGRELDLKTCRDVIAQYEGALEAANWEYYGDHETAEKVHQTVLWLRGQHLKAARP